MTAFFKRFKAMLDARDLTLHGVTTDGSPGPSEGRGSALYPEPIADVFAEIHPAHRMSGIQHQQCRFHLIKEINKDILKAVTPSREQLKVQKLKCSRGRPSGKKARRIARKNKQLQKKIAALFEHRHLFVKHTLTASEKKILLRRNDNKEYRIPSDNKTTIYRCSLDRMLRRRNSRCNFRPW